MLVTKQLKKSNNNIRFSIASNQSSLPKPAGLKVKKNKLIKDSKLHKNLSQLPIPYLPSKENASTSMANIMLGRGYSSLVASDVSRSLSRSRNRKQRDGLGRFCNEGIADKKQTNLAVREAQKCSNSRKNPGGRESSMVRDNSILSESKFHSVAPAKKQKALGVSNSTSKWNNRSVDEDLIAFKMKAIENRKKYNLSCGDMIEKKSLTKSKSKSKDKPRLGKKKSTLQATKINNFVDISKDQNLKETKKKNQKSKPKFKKVSIGAISKSKGSTALIATNKVNEKKKQKKKKGKKSASKGIRSKPDKLFIFSKENSDEDLELDSLDGYPTSKYISQKKGKKAPPKRSLNIKVGIQYSNSSCLNIITGSSGGVYNEQSSEIIGSFNYRDSNHILERLEYENNGSINIEEIKHYELNSGRRPTRLKNSIMNELEDEYPYLNRAEVSFLASVVMIQRKWREYSMHKKLAKNVITEYFLEDRRNSDDSRLIDISKSRQDTISRTKVFEFEQPDAEPRRTSDDFKKKVIDRHSIAQDRRDEQTLSPRQLDSSEYETRKPSPTRRPQLQEAHVEQEQSRRGSSPHESSSSRNQFLESKTPPSERKPKTEQDSANQGRYQWIGTKEVFPEIEYLSYRRDQIRFQFESTMKLISQDYKHQAISEQEFSAKEAELRESYNYELEQLKKTKYDIKKGCLRYIDCVNKVRQTDSQSLNLYGLRKVSSQDNFISVLYEKIFRFDSCISEWSGGSQEIETLTKNILIRRQFFGVRKQENGHQRRSFNDLRSHVKSSKSSFEMLKSSRELSHQDNTLLVFQHSEKISQDEQRGSLQIMERSIGQFRFSNELFLSKESNLGKEMTNSFDLRQKKEVDPNREKLLQKVEDELMLSLAVELEKDIHAINPVLVDMILINHDSPSSSAYRHEDDANEDLPIIRSLNEELENLPSPRASPSAYEHEFIPIVHEHQFDENADTVFYLNELQAFLKAEEWEEEMVANMNNNQAFEAMTYLRFLREFEVPEDEYVPIISNEKFIDWEATFINQFDVQLPHLATAREQEIFKQSRAIFHRCIFEVFLGELEKARPYGEKGRPFPWEDKFSVLYVNEVTLEDLPRIMKKTMQKVEEYLSCRCGVISEKHFIGSEEDLERMHEDNQDRIIEMLEQDLRESPHQWYETDEHNLEIKLELTYLIEEQIMDEVCSMLRRLSRSL